MIERLLINNIGYALIERTQCNFIGALISGGASLLGGAISAGAGAATAAANRKWQTAENQKQRDFQEYMTQKYSTLQAQRDQAIEAGLNPNLLFGSGSSGSVASAPSSVSAPNAEPNTQLGDAVTEGGRNVAQALLQQGQNDYYAAMADKVKGTTPSDIKKAESEADVSSAYAKLADENASIDLQLKNAELNYRSSQTAAARATANKFDWECRLIEYDLAEMKPLEKEQLQTSIAEELARIGLLVEQKQLTINQAKLAIANTYKAYSDAVSNRISANASATSAAAQMQNAQTNALVADSTIRVNDATSENLATSSVRIKEDTKGIQIDNDTKLRSQQYVLKSFEIQNEILGKQNKWYNVQQVGSLIRDVGVGVGSAVGGISTGASKFASGAVPIQGFH